MQDLPFAYYSLVFHSKILNLDQIPTDSQWTWGLWGLWDLWGLWGPLGSGAPGQLPALLEGYPALLMHFSLLFFSFFFWGSFYKIPYTYMPSTFMNIKWGNKILQTLLSVMQYNSTASLTTASKMTIKLNQHFSKAVLTKKRKYKTPTL